MSSVDGNTVLCMIEKNICNKIMFPATKIRLYPTEAQREKLTQALDCTRWLAGWRSDWLLLPVEAI